MAKFRLVVVATILSALCGCSSEMLFDLDDGDKFYATYVFSGRVTDASGNPIEGIEVDLETIGTSDYVTRDSNEAMTDADGRYIVSRRTYGRIIYTLSIVFDDENDSDGVDYAKRILDIRLTDQDVVDKDYSGNEMVQYKKNIDIVLEPQGSGRN